MVDNHNDRYGNIRDINIIFFSVWRNLVIRNEILFHTRLFNIHLGRRISFTLDELPTYKYKHYLDVVELYQENLRITNSTQLLPNVIPYGVSDVKLSFGIIKLDDNSLPNTVTTYYTFALNCGLPFKQSLAGEWLPNSLKSLFLPRDFHQKIGVNQLPESLTELNFQSYSNYKGKIEPGSIPLIAAAKPFEYTWECECEKELTNQESSNVPISTTKYGISKYINEGDIPHNAISIKFSKIFNGKIQGALPASLRSLEFSFYLKISISDNILPSSNLTSIDMGSYSIPFGRNFFPQSITSIKFHRFDKPISKGCFYNYTNLKSLVFVGLNKIIPENTLPPSLTLLDLGILNTHSLTENVLPASLSILKLGYYQHTLNVKALPTSLSTLEIRSSLYVLGTDQLPSSITSLSIYTKHLIPVGSLPCNLKELYINNSNFNQDLTEEGILPKSIQSIYLHCKVDKNYINNLDVDFFKKYIKFIK